MFLSQLFEARVADDASQAGVEAARRHPGAFIHFTNVPKLGINPSKQHKDAPGIYFYPCRWIINPENLSAFQYGLTMAHYYIARLKPSARVVNLGTLTMPQARRLAQQAGWGEDFERIALAPRSLTRDGRIADKAATRKKAGYLWYGGMDHLANIALTHSWVELLRGVDAIYDPGYGIVHPDEPAQMIAMRRDVIDIIESGPNKDISRRVRGRAMAEAARQLGGSSGWRDGFPYLRATVDGKPVEVEDRDGADFAYSFQNGVWVSNSYRSHHETDEKGLVDAYLSFAQLAARDADAEGRISKWSLAAVNRLMRMIPLKTALMPTKVMHAGRPLVPHGVLVYASVAGFGADKRVKIEVQPDDSLSFEFDVLAGRDDGPFRDFTFKRSFPPTMSAADIAAEIGKKLPDALMQRVRHLPRILSDGRKRRDVLMQVFGLTA